ncbi:RusA family crossover junction endodeoxyribonuclease [Mycolicibacterium fortuitum]|uniref:RusA family crossover junction endodeoxyribonuclease n=1 Tax=Mycolicibacterium fortuitum TaxID=1766 RepID=UPI003F4CB80A
MFVPGIPAPQGSKRHVGGGRMIESSKKLKPWRRTVAEVATTMWRGQPIIRDVALLVRIVFTMPRPVSLPKTKPTPPAIKRPDQEKLERAVLDALTYNPTTGQGVFADDSAFVRSITDKEIALLGEQPGALITVATFDRAVRVDDWAADEWWLR